MDTKHGLQRILTLPNLITCIRIAGALALIWMVPFSPAFYTTYLICGLSDGLDGFAARVTGQTSEFGRHLDSVADLVLYGTVFLKLLPAMTASLAGWIWIWLAAAVILRLMVYALIAIRFRKFAATHTWLDKLSSILVFLVPFSIEPGWQDWGCSLALFAATAASLEELIMFAGSSQYDPSRRTVLQSPQPRQTRQTGSPVSRKLAPGQSSRKPEIRQPVNGQRREL
ncbi:CDP-alcohol phosphatidyltransferase family protein [uncultured Faecalibaculum sp.]|uniref:CDP-alcohol phosphatidyltransferase family protein n=1 Tax=uncultured Faecalibaculum sp. TaxID=1729681 RepID=UPI0025E15FBD|nr:CDP-alcohol phosphatidyltransferase family protein [uncultured Faecalibaculum sp.]